MTPAEIAASLSEAQRRALLAAFPQTAGGLCVRFLKRGDPSMPTVEALCRKGLVEINYSARCGVLSPLGLSVRRALLENSHD